MHKIHYIGSSGVIFTVCGDVRSSIRYIMATEIDSAVACQKCLNTMANKSLNPTSEASAG